MLPYFEQTTIQIGPLVIYIWGLFIALGFGAFLAAAYRESKRTHTSFDSITDLSLWTIFGAFLGARLAHVLFYEPSYFLAHPTEILKVWNGGLSSVGGIIFGVATALFFVWYKKMDVKVYGDVIMRCMPVAWIFGRFGCYVTHMHPGIRSATWFAVAYPGAPRFDLGLLECVGWILIGLLFWLMPKPKKSGTYLALVPLLYAPLRFGLDFFRSDEMLGMSDTMTFTPDARYFGLTPAQYGMIALFGVGVWMVYRFKLLKNI
ncbi:MAG: prolipoprotein diacylglyceryl transferase [Candidatus Magasanikbacteria bacterium]|nr:prolipoprotein diacylglyceryl transferase [Candidatus Magasanikbacteria bacterium]